MSLFENVRIVEFEKTRDLLEYTSFKSEFLSEIWNEKYEIHFKNNFNVLENQLLLLAKIKNNIVGQLFIPFKNNIGYIEEIEVSSKFQNSGIGKKLINTFQNMFPLIKIELLVKNDNITAISFYEKLGFILDKSEGNFLLFSFNNNIHEAA
jgi:ribosomal protein S18 acetylase RimI-like enzyme